MRLERCGKGHFYDADKFKECPHCSSGAQDFNGGGSGNIQPTAPFNPHAKEGDMMDSTVAMSGISGLETMPVKSPDKGPTQGSNAFSNLQQMKDLGPQRMDNPSIQQVPQRFSRGEDDQKTVRMDRMGKNVRKAPVVGWLVCLTGDGLGRSYELKAGKNFIGRGQDQDVVLEGDRSVSRDKHAIIMYEPHERKFLAIAGDSHELFYLNDKVVVSSEELNPFDTILLGQTQLIFIPLCGPQFAWDEEAEE